MGAGAVENRDDDDQSDCVGKVELRVLGAFRDSSESVRSRNCDFSSGGLVDIKFELDFHCREWYEEPGSADNLGMKKSSIDGKQYLDY